jgi:hypothetical protein
MWMNLSYFLEDVVRRSVPRTRETRHANNDERLEVPRQPLHSAQRDPRKGDQERFSQTRRTCNQSYGLGKARWMEFLLRGTSRQKYLSQQSRVTCHFHNRSVEMDSWQHMATATEAVFLSTRWNSAFLSRFSGCAYGWNSV